MTPKEKADELFDKIYNSKDYDGYCNGCGLVFEQAKDIALIAVNEIISELEDVMNFTGINYCSEMTKYWKEVKQEIEKL